MIYGTEKYSATTSATRNKGITLCRCTVISSPKRYFEQCKSIALFCYSKDQFTYRKVEGRISTASVALGLARTSILGRQCQLTNLKKFTRYNIVVQAFNALGLGPMSSEVSATTLEDGD